MIMVVAYSHASDNKLAVLAVGGHTEVKYSEQKRFDGSWIAFYFLFWRVDSDPRDVLWSDV
jgi:hypothetical protein